MIKYHYLQQYRLFQKLLQLLQHLLEHITIQEVKY
jgi:hypothetical protein